MNRQLKLVITGAIFAVLPYLLFIGMKSEVIVNGVLQVRDRLNLFGILGGLIAVGLAWSIVMKWERPADKAPVWRVAGVLIGLAGIAQVLYSVGIIG